jgi:hypothetical protein
MADSYTHESAIVVLGQNPVSNDKEWGRRRGNSTVAIEGSDGSSEDGDHHGYYTHRRRYGHESKADEQVSVCGEGKWEVIGGSNTLGRGQLA